MKVIFLDFDGVITSAYENLKVDDLCIAILKYIINKTGAKIVITSSTKESVQVFGVPFVRSNLRNIYLKRLEQYDLYPYDYTPYIGSNRELEIKNYLDNHPDITEYLILDDDSVLNSFNGHQVLIDNGWGLSLKDIKNSIEILNGNLKFYDLSKTELDCEKREIQSNEKFNQLMKRKNRIQR